MAPKRELIATSPVSEFGELDPTLDEGVDGIRPDFTYVPGWSDVKHQRDIALAEYQAGTRAGKDVPTLPGNVRWVRCRAANGHEDGVKLMGAKISGYRAMTKSDLGTAYLTAMPPGSRELPDGAIVNSAGDCQLMFCEAPVAARNLRNKTNRWLDASHQVRAAEAEVSSEGLAFKDIQGADNQSIVESTKPSDGRSVKRGT